jgi:hypothetical protein
MGRASRIGFVLLVVGFVSLPHAVLAQYPPPAVNPECHTLIGGTGTVGGRTVFPYMGTFRVEGEPGCTEGGSTIVVDGQSHRHNLHPGFTANADGSFRSPAIQLSAHMTPGPHNIIPRFTVGNVEFFCPILIVDAAGRNTNGGGGGLNNAANRDGGGGGGGGGGGVLPRTGAGILMLIVWAIALIAAGTALVFAARRGGLRVQPLRVVSTRFKRRSSGTPLALPPPDVPFIDTTGFVPVRPKRPAVDPGVTEADVQHDHQNWDD